MVDAGLPISAEHVEVLERLRQLTTWQQAQQERLRAHQQLQIARLRGCEQDSRQLTTDSEPGDTSEHSCRQQPQSYPLSGDVSDNHDIHTAITTLPPPVVVEEWNNLQQVTISPPVIDDTLRNEQDIGESGYMVGSDSGLETGCHGSEDDIQQRNDRPIQPGVGEDDTFEDLLERQLKLPSTHQASSPRRQSHKTHTFLRRGEGLVRYRGGQQSKVQKSKVQQSKVQQSSKKNIRTAVKPHNSLVRGSQFSSDESFIIRGCERDMQEKEELVEFEQLEKAAFSTSFSQCVDGVGEGNVNGVVCEGCDGGESGVNGVVCEGCDGGDMPLDLDKTLTPSQTMVDYKEEVKEGQSLAAGIMFSDDEEWESFSHLSPSPPPHITTTITSQPHRGTSSLLASPMKQSECLSSTPLSISPTHHSPPIIDVPPPSALAARLFPALKRERQQILRNNKQTPPLQLNNEKTTPAETTPPHYPSEPEFREKLCQLETEIERFRSLNSRLELQNKEKEEGLAFLKKEMTEFQQQMKQEMEQFEHYKQQEIKKLRKERRLFEVYIQECRAGLERKDKEEIESLRNEINQLQEELASREERWRSALARQRQRVTALEGQNRELQGDLRMMERERLAWWQDQLEKRKHNSSSPSPTPHIELPVKTDPSSSNNTHTVSNKPSTVKPGTRKHKQKIKRCNIEEDKTRAVEGDRMRENIRSVVSNRDIDEDKPKIELSSTTSCEIVEIISHDLSPPQSDMWSGVPRSNGWGSDSEGVGSDVSAIADDIVDKVIGRSVDRQSQGAESKNTAGQSQGAESKNTAGQSQGVESSNDEKTVKSRVVRFALENTSEGQKEKTPEQQQHDNDDDDDGSKVILCSNGTKKIMNSDGVTLKFANGDTKYIKPDNTVVYYYSQSQTTHITHPNGLEEIHFPNQQTEKVFPDGRREVKFPDGTRKIVQANGVEESIFADGTIQRLLVDGTREIIYTNGQKETHTQQYKRREYPDGTLKTVYPDGKQETRYASGRLRVKDSVGNILVDTCQYTQ